MTPIELHVITKAEQESIQAILDSGALGIKNGSATIHFDEQGNIRLIEAKQNIYRQVSTRQKRGIDIPREVL